ncbi:hypothetical protein [Sandarakinorhabdus sp. DWP1-3-1]|uniref:hypothetical protein n=1 Tax=Sandarakinorhabdus sp. DWP1-3-1 TaxID=2804627 RepID=UPI003CE9C7E2
MRHTLALLSLALGLAACGGDSDTTTTVSTADGDVAVTTSRDGQSTVTVKGSDGSGITIDAGATSWPADAPAHAPPYPGGTITGAMKSVGKGTTGSQVIFETGDAPASVIAFYKQRAEKAGLPEQATLTNATTALYSAGANNGPSIIIQASTEAGKTTAVLTFGNGVAG